MSKVKKRLKAAILSRDDVVVGCLCLATQHTFKLINSYAVNARVSLRGDYRNSIQL